MIKQNYMKKLYIMIIALICYFCLFSLTFAKESDTKPLEIYSNNVLLMDVESGNVLFEEKGYNKVYPASTTKILTALIALENLDLDAPIVASKNAVYSTPAGSSIIAIQPGEVMSVKNLLYGLMLHSGNDAANVLAEAVSGNSSAFIDKMNEKLKEIGCTNSHFTNAHGFHDEAHYTTAFDMAKLMQYAMKNTTFREIVETKKYTIPATNKSPERVYTNTNKTFNENYTKMYYPYMLGGKTGYTEEARGTFVGYAKKDDKLVIVSLFDGSQNIARNEARFLDSITLLNYAFDHFTKQKVCEPKAYTFDILDKETRKIYTVALSKEAYALLPSENATWYSSSYVLNVDFPALTQQSEASDTAVGNITISLTGDAIQTVNTYPLILVSSKKYFNISFYNVQIATGILILVTVVAIIMILKLFQKPKKRSRHK